MNSSIAPRTRRMSGALVAVACTALVLTGCVSNEPRDEETAAAGPVTTTENDEPGDEVVIGFSAPAADHGWMGAITTAAKAEAEKYEDVDLQVAEGTKDVNVQISQIEGFIDQEVDAIVLLPFDGAALTDVALDAMEAGIPVINVDREFTSPFAARTTVLGDNYGMGVSAGTYICEQIGDNKDAVVAEIAGIDGLPLTTERSDGFKDALGDCGLDVDARVAAEFTVESGEEQTANLLSAEPEIDAIWNHDDDQGIGVLAAIENAGRDEFFLVGGAGSSNMMEEIQDEESVVQATVIYPSTQAADGVKLARLIAQNKTVGDLASIGVPRTVQLFAPVVTADNVEEYLPIGFDS